MKIVKQTNKQASRLVLFFAGWSVSPELFKHLEAEADTDVWICYDYRELTFNENPTGYKYIYVIAWSLGVWVAAMIWKKQIAPLLEKKGPESPCPALAIAINGTPYPIHDTFGIPVSVFQGTLDNMTEEGIQRFNRRMCGSRERFSEYEKIPARPLDEIREELQNLSRLIGKTATNEESPITHFWTKTIISDEDRIFPVANLCNYWKERCPITKVTAPHNPFYLWNNWRELWEQ